MIALRFLLIAVFAVVSHAADEDVTAPQRFALKRAATYSEQYHGQIVVVMYDGTRIFEQYGKGGNADRLQMSPETKEPRDTHKLPFG
jgi:hypothetical protein